ncbi:hypothetical protein [Clostridium estertheticum]|nr:hypothetical protein [Clostridium estertheticum]
MVVRTEFLKDHPQIVEAFIKNHIATTEYLKLKAYFLNKSMPLT